MISDFVTLGERFHAIDYEALYESSVYTTIPKKEKMEKEDKIFVFRPSRKVKMSRITLKFNSLESLVF